jgi:GAF domain-containing protein
MMRSSREHSPDELRWLAEEQAALRRVATLVARAAPPAAVFAVVAEEVGRLFAAGASGVVRYEPDDAATLVGSWSGTGDARPVGTAPLGGQNVTTLVFKTGRPARIDRYPVDDSSAVTATARGLGGRSSVGVPISVQGRLWGMMAVGSPREAALPTGTEERLADFAELVATAIANTEAREELRAIAEEQAALRRVATLVAHGVGPDLVFAAVAEEVGKLFGADLTGILRFEPDGELTFLAGHGVARLEPGARDRLKAHPVLASVRETGRAARLDADDATSTGLPETIRAEGVRSAVNAPIVVEGRVWGAIGRRHHPGDATPRRHCPHTRRLEASFAPRPAGTVRPGWHDPPHDEAEQGRDLRGGDRPGLAVRAAFGQHVGAGGLAGRGGRAGGAGGGGRRPGRRRVGTAGRAHRPAGRRGGRRRGHRGRRRAGRPDQRRARLPRRAAAGAAAGDRHRRAGHPGGASVLAGRAGLRERARLRRLDHGPRGQAPTVWFQQMDAPRPQRNRIHLDVSVPHDEAEGRIKATLAAGGTLVSDDAAPAFWTLADPEGNEACICTWQSRD